MTATLSIRVIYLVTCVCGSKAGSSLPALGWPEIKKSGDLAMISILASDHKYLRIRDLCKELGIVVCARILERERQAKTDAGLVPLCPLVSMVPVFWR